MCLVVRYKFRLYWCSAILEPIIINTEILIWTEQLKTQPKSIYEFLFSNVPLVVWLVDQRHFEDISDLIRVEVTWLDISILVDSILLYNIHSTEILWSMLWESNFAVFSLETLHFIFLSRSKSLLPIIYSRSGVSKWKGGGAKDAQSLFGHMVCFALS